MATHPDILLDFNNMMEERVGPVGILPSEIEALEPTIRQTQRGLTDLRKLGQLPYRDLPYQEELLQRVLDRAAEIRSRFKSVLLLGTGGSSLSAACFFDAFGHDGGLPIEIVDDLQPLAWERLTRGLAPKETLLMVVSKSGKTVETLAAFVFFRKWLLGSVGEVAYRKQVLFVTDPRQGVLREIAEREKVETFPVPPGVGGRYSALSTVGLLPAALAGVDIQAIQAGARRMDERCQNENSWLNPAIMSAVLHYLMGQKKGRKIRVVMPYDVRLKGYTDWFVQLWGESLGKLLSLRGKEVRAGLTPVKALGSLDQHSQLQLYLEGPADKVVTFVAVEQVPSKAKIPSAYEHHPEFSLLADRSVHELLKIQWLATEAALSRSGSPNLTIRLRELSPHALGQLLYLAEVETVFAGSLYEINPFDQPGVEMIKRYIKGLLGAKGFEEYRQAVEGNQKDRRFII